MMPFMSKGIVIGYNAIDQDSVLVMFPNSGQIVGYPVKILHHGPADMFRVKQAPLPMRGTWGLVAFPDGDIRNGIWLGAYYPSKQNAVTSPPNDPTVEYDAHYSGDWRYLDGTGAAARQWADGSYFVAGNAGVLPTIYRQLVNTAQQVVRTVFSQSTRVPSPPAAFPFKFVHASGTSISVDVSGNAHIDLAAGKTLQITQGGGSPTDFLTLVSKLVTAFNNHVHGDPQGGNTTVPTVPWTSSTVDSTAIGISN